MLSAVAFVLMYLEIAIPIMPSFIKFDFSDLPALLGSFALGPVCGVFLLYTSHISFDSKEACSIAIEISYSNMRMTIVLSFEDWHSR